MSVVEPAGMVRAKLRKPSWTVWPALGLVLMLMTGCAHFAFSAGEYAELYIRALDSDGLSDVGAKIYLGDSGQVLTTEPTPTAVQLRRAEGWYPGQLLHLVLDAPGYRTGVHIVKIERWAATPQDASLNANNIDVVLPKDSGYRRTSKSN